MSVFDFPLLTYADILLVDDMVFPDLRGDYMRNAAFSVGGCVALALLVSIGPGLAEPLVPTRLTPEEFKWDQPSSGSQRVKLVGDEQKPGMYMYRVRFPAN